MVLRLARRRPTAGMRAVRRRPTAGMRAVLVRPSDAYRPPQPTRAVSSRFPSQEGGLSLDALKGYLNTISSAGRLYSGPVGTAIRNALPSSDGTARPGFPGETHSVLRLKNGRPGVANFMGPGTRIAERISRGDPPRTEADRAARAHDVRYGLARNASDIRAADEKLVKALKRIEASNSDSRLNTRPAMRAIQAKMLLEKTGVVGPRAFAEIGGVPSSRRKEFEALDAAEDAAGYGLHLPGGSLKQILLSQSAPPRLRKSKKGGAFVLPGGALSLPGGAVPYSAMATLVQKAMPSLWKVLAKMSGIPFHRIFARGRGLKLAGQGVPSRTYKHPRVPFDNIMAPLHASGKHVQFGEGFLDSFRAGVRSIRKGVTEKVIPGMKKFISTVAPFAKEAASVILPVMLQVALTKGAAPQAGGYLPAAGPPGGPAVASLGSRLMGAITRLLARAFSRGRGAAQVGSGFWKDFANGFMSVIKPAWNVAKTVAPIVPLLL